MGLLWAPVFVVVGRKELRFPLLERLGLQTLGLGGNGLREAILVDFGCFFNSLSRLESLKVRALGQRLKFLSSSNSPLLPRFSLSLRPVNLGMNVLISCIAIVVENCISVDAQKCGTRALVFLQGWKSIMSG